VPVETQPTFRTGTSLALFDARIPGVGLGIIGRNYGVAADGQHFIVNQPVQRLDAVPITIVMNWLEELKQRAPTR
jgi:hypothetical protein